MQVPLLAKGPGAPARRAGAVALVGRLEEVQAPQRTIVGQLLGGLMDDPGIRLAATHKGQSVYRGTGLAPQRFNRPPASINTLDEVRGGRMKMVQRRAMGRTRGAPEV